MALTQGVEQKINALNLRYRFPIVHSLHSSWRLTNVQVGSEFCQQSLGQWDNHEISQDRSFSSLGPNRQSHSLWCEALFPFILIYSSTFSACSLQYSFKEMRKQTLNWLSTIEYDALHFITWVCVNLFLQSQWMVIRHYCLPMQLYVQIWRLSFKQSLRLMNFHMRIAIPRANFSHAAWSWPQEYSLIDDEFYEFLYKYSSEVLEWASRDYKAYFVAYSI